MSEGTNEGGAARRPERPGARYVVKARTLGADVASAFGRQDPSSDPLRAAFGSAQVIDPDYNPATLLRIYENSGALGPNVEAYVVNIDGFGHRLEAAVDLESDEAWETVRESLWLERVRDAEARGGPEVAAAVARLVPSDEEVDARLAELRREARLERIRAEAFLNVVNPRGSFTQLRRETRRDLEITGNAYWEVLRTRDGRIARFVRVPPTHVRCTALDPVAIAVEDRVPLGLTGWETVTQRRRFRRYVQAVGGTRVWFKEFGDPRVVSRKTGRVYPDIAAFEEARTSPDDGPANEIIHFRIDFPGSPYGAPRWVGNLLAVLGSRAADEVNYAYFDNKAVPPLALLVSGGVLAEDTVRRIEEFVDREIKGRDGFHKILVVEAVSSEDDLMPGEAGGAPRIKFEKLVDAQQGDALFQHYDERNIDKVGASFRLPRLLRGDTRDFNRATALAALKFADEQVFQPERDDFDAWFNRVIMPELGVRLWRFRSLGPRTRDFEAMVEGVERGTRAGAITPNEARGILAEAFGRDLPAVDSRWMRQPLPLTQLGLDLEAEAEAEDALAAVEPSAPSVGADAARAALADEPGGTGAPSASRAGGSAAGVAGSGAEGDAGSAPAEPQGASEGGSDG